MTKSYKEVMTELTPFMTKLKKEIPDVMNGFGAMMQSATKEGVLSTKTKELIALALGVASRCDGCIAFHTQALHKLGMTREELLEVLGMAVYMGGGPSYIYAAYALKAYEEMSAISI
ncbi:MAG: carboxymuconolactone decarboxylase family protein [Chlamydiae bacterium]|nr:carboxymuconolactone decarboxylase family protein [Chlamydiota bacterium]